MIKLSAWLCPTMKGKLAAHTDTVFCALLYACRIARTNAFKVAVYYLYSGFFAASCLYCKAAKISLRKKKFLTTILH